MLACAYAENGGFDKAAAVVQEGLGLATNENQKKYFLELIEAFKKKMTYIEYQEAKKQK